MTLKLTKQVKLWPVRYIPERSFTAGSRQQDSTRIAGPVRSVAKACGLLGMGGDVAEHRVQVTAPGVQRRIGIVFGGPPYGVPLVPEK